MFLLWWLCADNYTQPSWVSYVPCPWSRTVFQPVHFAPLDHRRWQNYRDAVVELYPHCSMFNFQGTPVPTFQLGPRTPPTILECACDELCCGMCAVLCRLGASTRCQRRCALAVRVSGFNWALFTWQGTHRHTTRCALAVRWGSTAKLVGCVR